MIDLNNAASCSVVARGRKSQRSTHERRVFPPPPQLRPNCDVCGCYNMRDLERALLTTARPNDGVQR